MSATQRTRMQAVGANSPEKERPRFAECAGCHAFHRLVKLVSEDSPDGYIYLQPTHTCTDGHTAESPR
jgi:hypothetical protein